MRSFIGSSFIAGALVLTAMSSSSMAITYQSGGKTLAVFTDTQATGVANMSTTLVKGKKGQIVTINVTYNGTGGNPGQMTVCLSNVGINGVVAAQPSQIECNTCPSIDCVISGTYVVDLDTAEANNPGNFYGQPLSVTATGTIQVGGGTPIAHASLVARMEKKK